MRFEDGMPTDLYLNAHSFGAFYTYGPGIFTFVRGKSYVLNNQANFILYFVKIQQVLITIESPPRRPPSCTRSPSTSPTASTRSSSWPTARTGSGAARAGSSTRGRRGCLTTRAAASAGRPGSTSSWSTPRTTWPTQEWDAKLFSDRFILGSGLTGLFITNSRSGHGLACQRIGDFHQL